MVQYNICYCDSYQDPDLRQFLSECSMLDPRFKKLSFLDFEQQQQVREYAAAKAVSFFGEQSSNTNSEEPTLSEVPGCSESVKGHPSAIGSILEDLYEPQTHSNDPSDLSNANCDVMDVVKTEMARLQKFGKSCFIKIRSACLVEGAQFEISHSC